MIEKDGGYDKSIDEDFLFKYLIAHYNALRVANYKCRYRHVSNTNIVSNPDTKIFLKRDVGKLKDCDLARKTQGLDERE